MYVLRKCNMKLLRECQQVELMHTHAVLKITVGHRPISVQKLGGAEIRDYGRPSCPSTKWPTTLSVNEGTKCERLLSLFLCSGSVEYR